MNYSFKIPLFVASMALIAVVFAACTDHFEDMNTPPTSVTEIDPNLVLTGVLRNDGIELGNYTWNQTRTVGSWAQHWSQVTGGDIMPDYYQPDLRNEDSWWEWHYPNYLKNIDRVQALLLDISEGDEMDRLVRSRLAIARIYEVRIWDRVTASLGDVPFTEAIQGLELNTTPAYDPQEEIYPALLEQLSTNIDRLTDGDVSYGSADIIYGGDIDKWRRYGNTLLLRTALRVSNADPGMAEQYATQAMNGDLISNHDESAMLTTENDVFGFQSHPILAEYRTGFAQEAVLAEHLVETLTDLDDPRLTLIAEPTQDSKDAGCEADPIAPDFTVCEYVGAPVNLPAGDYDALGPDQFSFPANAVWVDDGRANRMQVLHYAESLFLQAEAALRGWGGTRADAEVYFEQGVRAGLEIEPYSDFLTDEAQILAFVDQHGTLSADDEEALEQIMTHKWISLFSQGSEAYFEWRRTGYPDLDPGPGTDGITNGEIPRRLMYPRQERALNSTNLDAAISNQGPDDYTTRMWIDPQ